MGRLCYLLRPQLHLIDAIDAAIQANSRGTTNAGKVAALHEFNWRPGIGDPTIGGWVTAVISCWITARNSSLSDRKIWYAITVLFLGLGINKQLDLQSAVTEMGRIVAIEEGWYARRETVQLYFIIVVALVCSWAIISMVVAARSASFSTWLALVGTTMVIGFVLIRAASFHHIDRFIGSTVLGFRWNWILEMGGISVVIAASLWRRNRKTANG